MFSCISLKNVILLENVSSCLCPGSHTVRLVGGQTHCEGTLEGKYRREWRPLYDIWSLLSQQNLPTFVRRSAVQMSSHIQEATWKETSLRGSFPQDTHNHECEMLR